MFRYFLALLLVSTYSRSLGVPLKETAANGPLANLFTALASHCENALLTSQIKAKLNDCNVIVPPYDGKQFECMLFYDINKQLCEATSPDLKGLSEDFNTKINNFLDVETTCTNAKNWSFTDISEYPKYKETVSKVFQAKLGCLKACAVEDLTSQDTNFFCKYFKWGTDALSGLKAVSKTVQSDNPTNLSSYDDNKVSVVSEPIKNSPEVPTAVGNSVSTAEIISRPSVHEKISSEPLENNESSPKVDSVATKTNNADAEDSGKSDIKVQFDKPIKPAVPSSVNTASEEMEKPVPAEIVTPKKETVEKEEVQHTNNDNLVKDHIEEQKDTTAKKFKSVYQSDPIDYNDSDDAKEGLMDGDDGGDDPMLGADLDTKPDISQTQTSKSTKKLETPMTFVGEREFYPNSIQDQFVEDDDHFFPFFLTAVILVVVLYVLYHNKSKVSKMVLGLIVEGRQPGRRRNSRGHAYKRLDTLEQAISTNTAAPPSKIIY